ncbi:MAG: glycine cleavage system aminomethyltransferase GcvT [Bacteroidetes bacterium]|nr:glycine cleavage system aminomethyltransferase GcvT [Bacteroidota bacterium]
MKTTALTDKHIALGAKMVEFAGYNMPVSYAGIKEEHHCVRNTAGMFDVSHMGEFILKEEGALDLIQRVISNDASTLEKGQAMYACMPNDEGGIVDDLLVYYLDDGGYMLVVNASNIEKDWNWIVRHNTGGVEMHNISDKTTLLAIQGPKAAEVLQPLTDTDLSEIPYYRFVRGSFAGFGNVIISATGYTGAGGFELYFENGHAAEIWDDIMNSGKEVGLQPIGLGARNTLRMEMGFCLYGNDIDDSTSPLEAGLGWITKLKKEIRFTNQSYFEAQKAEGLKRKLVGFKMKERGIPRKGYNIVDKDGNSIGVVTSGTQSPTLDEAIGMGYVSWENRRSGTEIYIQVRKKQLLAEVEKLPFVRKD